ncbi:uncharacterized protein LOC143239960 isoform X2 [Tachypleus tridentatus]|uniref:uncharacterized protein LOC143239960 isoform X2 n=1 Tax=Tachypleus tridentatus TaxID=6853 RepID=UPI003FD4431C
MTTKEKSLADSFIIREACEENIVQSVCMKEGKILRDEKPIIQSNVSKTKTSIQLFRDKEDIGELSNKYTVPKETLYYGDRRQKFGHWDHPTRFFSLDVFETSVVSSFEL